MQKNQYFLSLALCLPITAFALPTVAVGYYSNDEYLLPLLANSQDEGSTWTYPSPQLPCNLKHGELFTSSCSGLNCIAAGSYSPTPDSSSGYPLLTHSKDGGLTWKTVIDAHNPRLPYMSYGAQLAASSCAGLHCVVVGSYGEGQFYKPLIADSFDGGATWNYSMNDLLSKLPPNQNGQFYAANCSGLNCVAAGDYAGLPLVANSKDGGKTWTCGIEGKTPEPPKDLKFGTFTSAKCTGENCLAAGTYGDSGFGQPLIATSKDGGSTWAYTLDSTTPSLPSDFILMVLKDLSCVKQNCMAVGDYYSTVISDSPLLAHSLDGGLTWTYLITSTFSDFPSNFKNGALSSVSCVGLNCVAAGHYYDETTSYPFIVNSKDGGASWKRAVDSTYPELPKNYSSGQLVKVHCKRNHCIASGSYVSEHVYLPLLAQSKDAGATWTYVVDGTAPNLPEGFKSGQFNHANLASKSMKKSES